MKRERDEPIPVGEQLFHALLDFQVHGKTVLHMALPMTDWIPRVSVSREKYLAAPFDALRKGKTGIPYTVLAVTTGERLPPDENIEVPDPDPRKRPSLRTFRFVAVDDPMEGDDAHAEVQTDRVVSGNPAGSPGKKIKSEQAKDQLRVRLATRFRVYP